MPNEGERNGEPIGNSICSPLPSSNEPRFAWTSSSTPARPSKRLIYHSQPADVTITCQPALRRSSTACGMRGIELHLIHYA